MKLSKARLPTGAATALTALLLLAPAALAQTAPWTLVTSPNASPGNNQHNAVASISASDVWAVGSADTAACSTIFGMAAVSSADVWAVGSVISGGVAQPLIEHWNGKKWAVVPSPS